MNRLNTMSKNLVPSANCGQMMPLDTGDMLSVATPEEQPPNYRLRRTLTPSTWIYQNAGRPFKDLVKEYLEKEINKKVVNYLKDFLEVNDRCKDGREVCKSMFNVVSQQQAESSGEDTPTKFEIHGHEKLEKYLESIGPENTSLSFCSIIAENICPYSICLLGVVFDINPGFWATHFENSYQTQEDDVDPWLLPLPSGSREREVDSFNIQYVEPRELEELPRPFGTMETIQTAMRPLDHCRNYSPTTAAGKVYSVQVNRGVQLLPVRGRIKTHQAKDESKYPVAFIPGPLSVKRTESTGGATVIVILIDPETTHLSLRFNYHLDKGVQSGRVKPRERVANFLSKYDRNKDNVTENAYYNIGRMISKQWQLVHGYMSRDVHLIQRKLEIIPSFDVAEKLLEDMFRHRQNCARYEKQLHDTMEEFKQSLGREDLPVIYDLVSIQDGFRQLSRTTERNINLLTDLTAIKEAQQGLDENHGITRLTHIATIYLPFSTVAAVLAMPDNFAPGANRFWVYWVASMILAAFVIMAVLLYKPAKSFLGTSQRREDDHKEMVIGSSQSEKSGGFVSRFLPQRRVSTEKRRSEGLPRFK